MMLVASFLVGWFCGFGVGALAGVVWNRERVWRTLALVAGHEGKWVKLGEVIRDKGKPS